MNFICIWLWGYTHPQKYTAALQTRPAPQWGLYTTLLRGVVVALLLYAPLAARGRIPPTPSYLTFLPTGRYYQILMGITPLVFLAEWLLGGSVMHIFLRLCDCPSDIDQILNITGTAAWVTAVVLLLWDWLWLWLGGANQYVLGISHLVIDGWWFYLVVLGLKEAIGVPLRQGIIASVLSFLVAFPLAVLFMRSPL